MIEWKQASSGWQSATIYAGDGADAGPPIQLSASEQGEYEAFVRGVPIKRSWAEGAAGALTLEGAKQSAVAAALSWLDGLRAMFREPSSQDLHLFRVEVDRTIYYVSAYTEDDVLSAAAECTEVPTYIASGTRIIAILDENMVLRGKPGQPLRIPAKQWAAEGRGVVGVDYPTEMT